MKSVWGKIKPIVASISLTSAHASVATVASFRTWRGSQLIVAKRPMLATMGLNLFNLGERGIRTLDTLLTYTRFPGVLLQPLGHLSSNKRVRVN